MNRFAKIVLGIGWLGAALWVAVFAQGFEVGAERPEVALHTVLALAAAASTILARTWCVVFLIAGSERFAGPGAAKARLGALIAAPISLALLAAQFVLAGRLLWGSVPPLAHATVGAALLAAHVVALRLESRALALESAVVAA